MRTRLLDRLLMFMVKHSHTLARRLSFTVPWQIGATRVNVPFMDNVGFQNLQVGPKDIALLRAVEHVLPRTPGAVVDVGANIGHFMELCLLVERERPYVGFDISLSCCYYLDRFIRENALPAHNVFPVGLAADTGAERVLSNGPFDVCASLEQRAHQFGRLRPGGLALTVPGDEVLRQVAPGEIALVKIDVEGLELEVLRGLRQTLERQRPYLIFEVLIYAQLATQPGDREELRRVAEHRRESALAIEAFLRERDYLVYRMQQDGALEYRRTLDPGESLDSAAMDHLALPREKAATLLADYPYPIDVPPEKAAAA